MEAKGRSGREVGKCGFVKVGGTEEGLEAPIARGEETGGREYIMTGIWGEVCYDQWAEGRKGTTYRKEEEGGVERPKNPAWPEYINHSRHLEIVPKESHACHDANCWGPCVVT